MTEIITKNTAISSYDWIAYGKKIAIYYDSQYEIYGSFTDGLTIEKMVDGTIEHKFTISCEFFNWNVYDFLDDYLKSDCYYLISTDGKTIYKSLLPEEIAKLISLFIDHVE